MNVSETTGLLATARALATDAACAEVVHAFEAEGIRSILLKGPTIADWLYPGEVRGYTDADLLIEPGTVMGAAAILKRLGFAPVDHHVSLHAHPWIRLSDGAEIDLHVTLWGPHRPAARLWDELQPWLQTTTIGRRQVRVLNLPGRALHVVLHAAQHVDFPKPREDLRRALERAPLEIWRDAERLGDRLWALGAMADGLMLEPVGERLLEQLPLARAAAVAKHDDAPLAIGFTRIKNARGVGGKARVLARAIARPRDELGLDLDPVQGRGIRVTMARAARAAWLLGRAPRTILAMRRQRKRR